MECYYDISELECHVNTRKRCIHCKSACLTEEELRKRYQDMMEYTLNISAKWELQKELTKLLEIRKIRKGE